MAKQILDKESKVVTVQSMSVAGGDLGLPQGHKYFVNLELDYGEIDLEEAISLASEGSSVRVKAQGKLRAYGSKKLEEGGAVMAESSVEVKSEDLGTFSFNVATDFESERGGPRDPQKQAQSAFKKMTREQRVATIAETLKISVEEAEKLIPAEEVEEQ